MEEETMLLGRNAPSDSELSSYLGFEPTKNSSPSSSNGEGAVRQGFLPKGIFEWSLQRDHLCNFVHKKFRRIVIEMKDDNVSLSLSWSFVEFIKLLQGVCILLFLFKREIVTEKLDQVKEIVLDIVMKYKMWINIWKEQVYI